MLEKLLNQKVKIVISGYAVNGFDNTSMFSSTSTSIKKGIVTDSDDEFIELDNKTIIAVKYITYIEAE